MFDNVAGNWYLYREKPEAIMESYFVSNYQTVKYLRGSAFHPYLPIFFGAPVSLHHTNPMSFFLLNPLPQSSQLPASAQFCLFSSFAHRYKDI